MRSVATARRHPVGWLMAGVLGVVIAAVGVGAFWLFGTGPSAPAAQSPAETPDQQLGVPQHISIPAIGVDARVVPIQLSSQGVLEPERNEVVGWYSGSRADFRYPVVKPGNSGSAVLTGHVDSDSGPAVFYKLEELSRGDRITIRDVHGNTATFTVTSHSQFPKNQFPESKVWNGTDQSMLRLITCGGEFNEATQHYQDNILVSAQAK